MSGNFLSCSKGVKDPLEVSEVICDSLETPQWKGAPLDVSGTLVFPLEWRQVCRGTS